MYAVTTCDLYPYAPGAVYVGDLEDILARARDDCALDQLYNDIIDAVNTNNTLIVAKFHAVSIINYEDERSIKRSIRNITDVYGDADFLIIYCDE